MVTIESLVRIGKYCWQITYSSDLPGTPTFYIYVDSVLATQTKQTTWNIALNLDESSVVEVLDNANEQPLQIFPGKARLMWFFVEDVNYYRVDEQINSVWTERKRLPENDGYLQFQSRFLEDGQSHLFRVVPVGLDGNEGTPKQFTVLMVRRPDAPNLDLYYSDGYGIYVEKDAECPSQVFITTGSPTPDCIGFFPSAGTYNGQNYYRRQSGGDWLCWYNGSNYWIISEALGDTSGPYWRRLTIPVGIFSPLNGASGQIIGAVMDDFEKV